MKFIHEKLKKGRLPGRVPKATIRSNKASFARKL